MGSTDQSPTWVITALRFPDFSFGIEAHERYEIYIPKDRLDAMSPLKRSLIKGGPKRLTLTADDRNRPKWRPLPPLFRGR